MIKHNNFNKCILLAHNVESTKLGFKEKRLVFDTLVVYPDAGTGGTTVDGRLQQSTAGVDWLDLSGAVGNGVNATSAANEAVLISSNASADKWSSNFRSAFLFDTSSIGSGFAVDSATLSLYGSFSLNSFTSTDYTVSIFSSNPDSNNALINTDYATIGNIPFSDTKIQQGSWSTVSYNVFTLNTAGINAIDMNGISKFGTKEATYDATGTEPTWEDSKTWRVDARNADNAGTTNDPKLTVEYSGVGGGFNSLFFGSTL